MKALSIRIARKVISGKDYHFSRMESMNNEVIYWVKLAHQSNHSTPRRAYLDMAQVYTKRYNYYLNKGGLQ